MENSTPFIINVNRIVKNDVAVKSAVFINGRKACYGLENISYLIPAGIYEITEDLDGKNGISISVLNVPNRSAIELHIANIVDELRGCIALGMYFRGDVLNQSRVAVTGVIKELRKHKQCYLIVTDSYNSNNKFS